VSAPEPPRRPPGEGREVPRPPSQRDLVAASLLRCPRGEPPVRHGKPAVRSGLPQRPRA
jgi:hypothetical protein